MATKFQWDRGNVTKSLDKHGISNKEAESIFKDRRRLILDDEKHSEEEKRYFCIGRSILGRVLISYFTKRRGKTRIIGTRPAKLKERNRYEKR